MTSSLPISRLINVNVTLAAQAAQAQALNSLLILSPNDTIDVSTRIRGYSTLAQVLADPTLTSTEILPATLWFEQNPQPSGLLYIGRWAKLASHGQLFGGALTPAQQAIGLWTIITNGGLDISIDGASAEILSGMNFSAALNMNGVAAVIQTHLTGATIVWDSVYNRFEVTSSTTGASSSVAFATTGTGTDVSGLLLLNAAAAAEGAYTVAGIIAETAVQAVGVFDTNFGQEWYALTIVGAVDADHIAVANYIEASNNKHFYGVTTQEAAVLTPGDTSDIAYVLSQIAGLNHTCVHYSSTSPYAVVSLFARILTTDYQGNNTVITLMYKQLPGIVPETLTQTQIAALEAKNCNVFVAYNNNTAIVEQGVSSSANFIDVVMGADALAVEIQTAIYNLLYTSPTKIPQTDAGVHLIVTTIAQVCQQFVADGYLAPGTWTSNGFGTLESGNYMSTGYYIYAQPVALQTQATRAARVAPPIQIAAKLAGAVQTVDVAITVNS